MVVRKKKYLREIDEVVRGVNSFSIALETKDMHHIHIDGANLSYEKMQEQRYLGTRSLQLMLRNI
jgi:hypothetical protein